MAARTHVLKDLLAGTYTAPPFTDEERQQRRQALLLARGMSSTELAALAEHFDSRLNQALADQGLDRDSDPDISAPEPKTVRDDSFEL